jgi:hypothetical protein
VKFANFKEDFRVLKSWQFLSSSLVPIIIFIVGLVGALFHRPLPFQGKSFFYLIVIWYKKSSVISFYI